MQQSYLTSVWTTLVAFCACVRLMWREQPQVVLANGPGTCLPVCVAASLLSWLRLTRHCDVVFVESVARVHRLSLCGWLLLKLNVCTLFVVQWAELAELYPRNVNLAKIFF